MGSGRLPDLKSPILKHLTRLVCRKPTIPLKRIQSEILSQRKTRVEFKSTTRTHIILKDVLYATRTLEQEFPDPEVPAKQLNAAKREASKEFRSPEGVRMLREMLYDMDHDPASTTSSSKPEPPEVPDKQLKADQRLPPRKFRSPGGIGMLREMMQDMDKESSTTGSSEPETPVKPTRKLPKVAPPRIITGKPKGWS